MKTEEFTRKDGTKGEAHSLEAGDEVECMFDSVGTTQRAVVIDGEPRIIDSHYLGIKTKDGKEVTIKITSGQKKVLDKAGNLTGKTIIATEYSNDFGTFVGVRVKKDK